MSTDLIDIGDGARIVDTAPFVGCRKSFGRGNPHDPRHGRAFKEATAGCTQKISVLGGKTCANLFFESSTRTKTSFSLAARRLGADTVDFSSSGSSLSKGETFIDTAKNIEAMGIDVVIVRHRTPGTAQLLAQNLELLGDQRRRRGPRTSDAGLARHPVDPRAPRPDRRADGGPGRRHRPQPHGPVEHLGPEKAGGARDRLRPFDAGFAALGRVWAWKWPTTWTPSCRAATC